MRAIHAFALPAVVIAGVSSSLAFCIDAGLIGHAEAATMEKFTSAAFEAALKDGPVLIEVTAPWCPTCKAQKPILSELLANPRFSGLTVLTVDFDSQKDALKTLGVNSQSTLINYKDGKEVGRSVGQTSKEAISAQIEQSL